eukprot:CAMPEP_0171060956 /NCGR_PEP_ID=MMETSP0766_2-20121228/4130_1 /TAXON_ID=439317 /ORGANISM="Gambierdiscus australes, Strain CAWD 149" /LENGTH=212 /DNA_ID=CAMNT_0011516579 /DNA_START=14 /DNA_END=652 /DNA_ORIENTATION=-
MMQPEPVSYGNGEGKARALAEKILRTVARGSRGPSMPATPGSGAECEKGQLESNSEKTYPGVNVLCTAMLLGSLHSILFWICVFSVPNALVTFPYDWWPVIFLLNGSNHFWAHLLLEVAKVRRTEKTLVFSNYFCRMWEIELSNVESVTLETHKLRGEYALIAFTPKYLKEMRARKCRRWGPCIPSQSYSVFLKDPSSFVSDYMASKKVSKE